MRVSTATRCSGLASMKARPCILAASASTSFRPLRHIVPVFGLEGFGHARVDVGGHLARRARRASGRRPG